MATSFFTASEGASHERISKGGRCELALCDDDQGVFALVSASPNTPAGVRAAHMALDVINHEAPRISSAVAKVASGTTTESSLKNLLGDDLQRLSDAIAMLPLESWDEDRPQVSVSALVVRGDQALLAHVGQTRIYVIRNNYVVRLTHAKGDVKEDDEVTGEREATMVVLPNRVTAAPKAALGQVEPVAVEGLSFKSQPGDRLVLVGATVAGSLRGKDIKEANIRAKLPAELTRAILDRAEKAGADGDVACVTVDVHRGERAKAKPAAASAPREAPREKKPPREATQEKRPPREAAPREPKPRQAQPVAHAQRPRRPEPSRPAPRPRPEPDTSPQGQSRARSADTNPEQAPARPAEPRRGVRDIRREPRKPETRATGSKLPPAAHAGNASQASGPGDLSLFKRVSLFEGLGVGQVRTLMGIMTPLTLHEEQPLFELGEDSDRFYVVVKGELAVDGPETSGTIRTGASIGDEALIEGSVRWQSVRALSLSSLAAVRVARLKEILDKDRDLAARLYHNVARSLLGV
jgi:serine/threonine protein phosphatase PrpC